MRFRMELLYDSSQSSLPGVAEGNGWLSSQLELDDGHQKCLQLAHSTFEKNLNVDLLCTLSQHRISNPFCKICNNVFLQL